VQAALGEEELDGLRQAQEANEIGNAGAILASAVCDFLVGEAEVVGEAFEGLRGFDGVEVLALDVLDEGELQELIVGEVLDDHRDLSEAGYSGSAESALAGDELESVAMMADNERLDDAVGADGLGKLVNPSLVELRAGLEGIGIYIRDGNFADSSALVGRVRFGGGRRGRKGGGRALREKRRKALT
jgi:hypothetical protein